MQLCRVKLSREAWTYLPTDIHTIPYHTIPYRTAPYHTIPYHTMPYHTIPYHTMHHKYKYQHKYKYKDKTMHACMHACMPTSALNYMSTLSRCIHQHIFLSAGKTVQCIAACQVHASVNTLQEHIRTGGVLFVNRYTLLRQGQLMLIRSEQPYLLHSENLPKSGPGTLRGVTLLICPACGSYHLQCAFGQAWL